MFILSKAQITTIPDSVFEQNLINLGLDTPPINGSVPTANIDTVKSLVAWGQNITDLTGIENFTALEVLDVQWDQLTSLNVTQNLALTSLTCLGNQITNLDVSQNTALTFLWCSSNQLTSLDVSQNSLLEVLYCHINQIGSLNLSNNPNLTTLSFHSNLLNSLNLTQNGVLEVVNGTFNQLVCLNIKNGNNTNITFFRVDDNPNLTCIEVDNVSYSNTNWTNIDAQTSYSINCSNPCVVGVQEFVTNDFTIYPNPTNGQITVSLKETTNVKLLLYNAVGQLVLNKIYLQTNLINLDLLVPKGIYFLRLKTPTENFTKKVIKN
jgi:Leucine-rich repeat (LRR) protein